MAAAAGKKEHDLFVLVHDLALKWKKRSPVATQDWEEGTWIGNWHSELREAWLNQALEVQIWRQVRGPAGAVMCETRDLGIEWPH